MSASAVRLLATVDVELARDRDLDAQAHALWRLGSDLRDFPVTLFCTATAAERFSAPLRALAAAGHEIGCHGRDHAESEDYRRMTADQALESIAEATARIESAVGVRPRCFRGPRMTTSATTQQALRRLDYLGDFSVCSHRADFMAASRFDWHWPWTGPSPYRPSDGDAFRSAGPPSCRELSVVPLSGFGLPLCSGTAYLFGERVARRIAATCRAGGARSGAAIVYLFHSYEFAPTMRGRGALPAHQRLYLGDAGERYRRNLRLLRYLRNALTAEPLAARAYLETFGDGRAQAC